MTRYDGRVDYKNPRKVAAFRARCEEMERGKPRRPPAPKSPPSRAWLRFETRGLLGIGRRRVVDAEGNFRCVGCDAPVARKARVCDSCQKRGRRP